MRAIPFSASGVVGSAVAASGGTTHLLGLIVTETAGSPLLSRINVRDKGIVGGAILLPVSIAASGTVVLSFNEPVAVNGACYVEVVAGTVVGALFIE